jgi:hypothetical protein
MSAIFDEGFFPAAGRFAKRSTGRPEQNLVFVHDPVIIRHGSDTRLAPRSVIVRVMTNDPSNDDIDFATTEYVEPNEELTYEIVRQVFGVEAGFISDLSSLDDFIATSERDEHLKRVPLERDIRSIEAAHGHIHRIYGVDVRPEVLIWRIVDRIARSGV